MPLTQAELGGAVGLTRTSITNIERGRQRILVHTLFEIAAELGIEPRDLLPPHGAWPVPSGAAAVPESVSEKDRVLIEAAITPSKRRK